MCFSFEEVGTDEETKELIEEGKEKLEEGVKEKVEEAKEKVKEKVNGLKCVVKAKAIWGFGRWFVTQIAILFPLLQMQPLPRHTSLPPPSLHHLRHPTSRYPRRRRRRREVRSRLLFSFSTSVCHSSPDETRETMIVLGYVFWWVGVGVLLVS